MKRRQFLTLLGGAAAAWPIAARTQQLALPVVGWLDSKQAAAAPYQIGAFRKGLNEAGFVEGRNIAIEYRWADDQYDRLPTLAADLVRRQVSAIVTEGATTPAAKAATSTIPIVFVAGADPVVAGLVSSLNRPGGNVTGVSYTTSPLDSKRLELLHELVPKSGAIAVLWDPNILDLERLLQNVETAARALGRDLLVMKAGAESEFEAAFGKFVQGGARALFLSSGAFYASQRRQLVALAARHALPTSYHQREFVEIGGLMSYGASGPDAYRRGGLYVGRILKGAKPGDLPVELPTKYELVINLATAKALRIEIPPKLLALADEVFE